MTLLSPHAHGYVLVDRRTTSAGGADAVDACLAGLRNEGWRQALDIEGLEAWLGPRSRLKAVQVHRRHVLIGDWRGGARSLASLIGESRSAIEIARRAVDSGWGRYVLAWIDDASDALALLRDPSGALDCVWWRTDGVTIASAEPPPELDPLWPDHVGIDWTTLADYLENVAVIADRLAVRGLSPVRPGELVITGAPSVAHEIWSPAAFCRRQRDWDDDPAALEAVVDQTTAALVSGHRHIVAELSGGLDSSVVAAGLVAAGRAKDAVFINYYGNRPEGDERLWAAESAETLGVSLEYAAKAASAVTIRQLMGPGQSLRPGLNGLDMAYDADMARRAEAAGATAILSGQGGDAVFHYAADPDIIVDRFRRIGPRALSPAWLTRMAHWTGTPAWALACRAFRVAPQSRPEGGHHWSGAEGLPPAKAGQLRALANVQLFWGDALRAREAELLQPLLAQPVVEHCLRIPIDVLTRGARDRALARQAFAHRLPARLIARRGKGDLTQHYGRVVHASLPLLRPFLLEGELASRGLIDTVEMARGLDENALIRHPASNRRLIAAALEAWTRTWLARLERRRRQVAIQPRDNALVELPDVARTGEGVAFPESRQQGRFPVETIKGAEEAPEPGAVQIAFDEEGRGPDAGRSVKRASVDIGLRRHGQGPTDASLTRLGPAGD